MNADWLVPWIIMAVPFFWLGVEGAVAIGGYVCKYQLANRRCEDFQILVPIWGDIKYLENVDYLSKYKSHVTLCTTGDESSAFYADLEAVIAKYGFQSFRDGPDFSFEEKPRPNSGERTTSGSMRDTIIRNALHWVTEPYVVMLDADTITAEDIALLVGELECRELDVASIRLEPSNGEASALTRLQVFEYDVAMRFRFLCPWLLSGACHAAKTKALEDIMDKHSLFFQGNDVETGLLAKRFGYQVGFVPFVVLTTVPADPKSWLRQRLAWAGGEFRLFIVNFKFIVRHPLFWIYGALVTICMFPLRWEALASPTSQLYLILGLYVSLIFGLNWKKRNAWLIAMPLYTLFLSLVMTPLGIVWYFRMALRDKNYGIITMRVKRAVAAEKRKR